MRLEPIVGRRSSASGAYSYNRRLCRLHRCYIRYTTLCPVSTNQQLPTEDKYHLFVKCCIIFCFTYVLDLQFARREYFLARQRNSKRDVENYIIKKQFKKKLNEVRFILYLHEDYLLKNLCRLKPIKFKIQRYCFRMSEVYH